MVLHLARGDIAQLVELRSCNWVVAITGWMSNCPGGNDSILTAHLCLSSEIDINFARYQSVAKLISSQVHV